MQYASKMRDMADSINEEVIDECLEACADAVEIAAGKGLYSVYVPYVDCEIDNNLQIPILKRLRDLGYNATSSSLEGGSIYITW